MSNLLKAVVVGVIIIVTQSGSVIVVGDLSARNGDSGPAGLTHPIPQTFTRHAVVRSEPNSGDENGQYPRLRTIGPRRGPVK